MKVSSCPCQPAAPDPGAIREPTLQSFEDVQNKIQTIFTLAGMLRYMWKRYPAVAVNLDTDRDHLERIRLALVELV